MSEQTRRQWLAATAGTTATLPVLAGCMGSSDDSGSGGGGDGNEPSAQNWPMYGVDIQNTGHHPNATGPQGDEVEVTAIAEIGDNNGNSPTIVDETLYVTGSGEVHAVDLATNEKRWSEQPIDDLRRHTGVGHGSVYATHSNTLVSIDVEDGTHQWESDVVSSVGGSLNTPRPTDDAIIIFGSSEIVRVDPETGDETSLVDPDPRASADFPAIDEDHLYFSHGATLYAFDRETGTEQWDFEDEAAEDLNTNVAVADGAVFVGRYAVEASSGDQRWRLDEESNFRSPGWTVANGLAYAIFGEYLLAVDTETGDIQWREELSVNARPIVADGTVYVAATWRVFAFDAETGEELWKQSLLDTDIDGGGIRNIPVVSDGRLYATGADGVVYAFADSSQ